MSPISLSAPPTRCRSRWPSTVCVSISARSSGVSLPGFVMISFGIAILPTSCSSAASSACCRVRSRHAHLVADRAASGRRRRGCASRCTSRRPRSRRRAAARCRGRRWTARARSRCGRCARARTRRSAASAAAPAAPRPAADIGRDDGGQQADRRQQAVDQEHPRHRAHQLAGRDTAGDALAEQRRDQVAGELRDSRMAPSSGRLSMPGRGSPATSTTIAGGTEYQA